MLTVDFRPAETRILPASSLRPSKFKDGDEVHIFPIGAVQRGRHLHAGTRAATPGDILTRDQCLTWGDKDLDVPRSSSACRNIARVAARVLNVDGSSLYGAIGKM